MLVTIFDIVPGFIHLGLLLPFDELLLGEGVAVGISGIPHLGFAVARIDLPPRMIPTLMLVLVPFPPLPAAARSPRARAAGSRATSAAGPCCTGRATARSAP